MTRMELTHIKGIGPSKQKKLTEAGIDTVEKLARCNVATVAAATGWTDATVKEYKQKAVAITLLEDIKGIGPATVKTLVENGIQSTKDFAAASSDFLAEKLEVTKARVQTWQTEATTLAKRVADDAKTPEGRKKLANEGKELAVQTAKKTQENVKKILDLAQKEGEAAIAKAKDLRERAPAALHEAREKTETALKTAEERVKALQQKTPAAVKDLRDKAEVAVKDAQAKVVELKDKTEAFLKTETEKVKAANEGLFARIKARIGKKRAA